MVSSLPVHNMELDQIILFGDSITQWGYNQAIRGWVAQVAHAYIRKLDVVKSVYPP